MLQIYRDSLEADGCFKVEYPTVFKSAADVIPSNIPTKMRMLMAATELVVFASHLRKPILWHGSKIPVNMISFLIGGSGEGKGVSIKSISKILEPGIRQIDAQREQHAKLKAVEAAEDDGKKPKDWLKYYSKPRNLKSAISTLPGTMKHLASLESGTLGAGYMYVDEIGSELTSNTDLEENIIALAIAYDNGEIPPKIVKGDDSQVEAIRNLPYSALLFGSPANIVGDEKVKTKFLGEFSTKLSRRSHFAYITEHVERMSFSTIAESRAYDRSEVKRVKEATAKLEPWFTALVVGTTTTPLVPTAEVEDLFSDYHRYNEWYADTIPAQFPITILHRKHLQWKSLKIAGALAILENSDTIEKHHMVEAIRFSEIYANDIMEFEVELGKESYELFADHMQTMASNGYSSISVHKLRKHGFIKGTGAAKAKMLELIDLARSYDDLNRYEYADNYIHFYEEAALDDEVSRDELI